MADTFGWFPPGDTLFSKAMSDIMDEIEEAASRGDQSSVSSLLIDAQGELDTFTKTQLSSEFRDGYRVGSPEGPISKTARDLSYSIRSRTNRNGQAALAEVQRWSLLNEDLNAAVRDKKNVTKIRDNAIRVIQSGRGDVSKAQRDLDSADSLLAKIQKRIDNSNVPTEPTVSYRRRRRSKTGARGTVSSSRPASEYFGMLERTSRAEIANRSYIEGHRDAGTEWFVVSDGPDCGWTDHRDPEKANGKVVRVEDVILLAHPNCRRTFQAVPGGPGNKKTKELIEDLTGVSESNYDSLVKGAAIAGTVFRVGSAVYQSPLTSRVIRAIVENKEILLGENAQKILRQFVSRYHQGEQAAVAVRGWAANEASFEKIRQEVSESVGEKLANTFDGSLFEKVKLSEEEMRVLLLKSKEVSVGELTSRYTDFLDYQRHLRDNVAGSLKAVGAAAQDENVLRELYGVTYHFNTLTRLRRGGELLNNAKKAIAAVDKAMEGIDPWTGVDNAVLAQVDLVRAVAASVDPFPWLRATKGIAGNKLRVSVGMTSQGRQDLAQTLWLKMRGQEYRAKFNRVYQTNHLGMIPKPDVHIRVKDIYEATMPRVSFLGKHVLNATIYAEGGKIIPVMHILPEGALGRQLGLRVRLTSDAVNDLVTGYKNFNGTAREYLSRSLRELPEDMIWTVELFRNGPIQASLRFLSDGLDSYAFKLYPKNEKIRAIYKGWNRNPEDALEAIKEVVIIPRTWGGFKLHAIDKDKLDAIVGLATMREGGLAEVARIIGVEYRQLLLAVELEMKKYGKRLDYVMGRIKQFRAPAAEYGDNVISLEEIKRRGRATLGNIGDEKQHILVVDALKENAEFLAQWEILKEQISNSFVFPVKIRYQAFRDSLETLVRFPLDLANMDGVIDFSDFVRGLDRLANEGHGSLLPSAGYRQWIDDPMSLTNRRTRNIERKSALDNALEFYPRLLDDAREDASAKYFYESILEFHEKEMGAVTLTDRMRYHETSLDLIWAYAKKNGEMVDSDTMKRLVLGLGPRDAIPYSVDALQIHPSMMENRAIRSRLAEILDFADYMEMKGLRDETFWDRFPLIKVMDPDEGGWGESAYAYHDSAKRTIEFNDGMFRQMKERDLMVILRDDFSQGHFANTGEIGHIAVHEIGHYFTLGHMSSEQKLRLWNKFITDDRFKHMFDEPTDRVFVSAPSTFIKKAVDNPTHYFERTLTQEGVSYVTDIHRIDDIILARWNSPILQAWRAQLLFGVSSYATTNWAEMMAEVFAQMIYDPQANEFTAAMLEFFREEGFFL